MRTDRQENLHKRVAYRRKSPGAEWLCGGIYSFTGTEVTVFSRWRRL